MRRRATVRACFAKFDICGAKDGKDAILRVTQMTKKKLATGRFRQGKLCAGVNCPNVIEKQRALWHFQDVAVVGREKLHAQGFVKGEVGGVHKIAPR